MTFAVRGIKKQVSDVEAELRYLLGSLNRQQDIIAKLVEQRDEALRQRDLLMLVAWSRWDEDEPVDPS